MAGTWLQQREVSPIPVGGLIVAHSTATVQMTGASPATITVPADAFGGAFSALFPLPQTSRISLSTQLTAHGPATPGVLKKDHWIGTRAHKDFSFCIGAAANPNCVDHRSTGQGAAPGQGTRHGLVRYTAGSNRFGGTMQMVLGGNTSVARVVGASPLIVLHLNVNGATPGQEAVGGAYDNIVSGYFSGGPITLSPGISAGGLITAAGPQVGTGPPVINRNHGFPWTTGTVYVRGTDPTASPAPTITTVTVTGGQSRTPNGAGTISLVAGGVTTRLSSGFTFMSVDQVTMTIPEPGQLAMLMPGTALLVGLTWLRTKRA
jgi:hypothetical protein